MKGDKLMTIAAAIFVVAAVVLPSPAGTRPYELDWANRTTDDRPVLLPLVSADGWTCETTGATACFTTACERVLFGDGVAHLAYKIPGEKGVIKLKPPAPVPIPPGSDTVSLWIWGNHTYYHFREVPWGDRLSIAADFLDAEGKPFSVFLHKFNHWNWHLVQRRLAPHFAARVAKGGTFTGFTLRGGNEPAGRWLELTSLAVFKEEFKPLAFKPRRKRGVQIFPNQPQGLNTGEGRMSRRCARQPPNSARRSSTSTAMPRRSFRRWGWKRRRRSTCTSSRVNTQTIPKANRMPRTSATRVLISTQGLPSKWRVSKDFPSPTSGKIRQAFSSCRLCRTCDRRLSASGLRNVFLSFVPCQCYST